MDWKRALSWGGGYPFAVANVAVAAIVLFPLRSHLQPPIFMLLFVPVIILVARFAGLRPAGAAAVVGFLLLDLVFVPPYYRLVVDDYQEWLALVVFLIVALATGQQAAQLTRRERSALDRQRELEFLNDLSFHIVSADSAATTAEFIVRRVTDVLGASRAALFALQGEADGRCLASAGPGLASPEEGRFVRWVLENSKAVGLPPGSGATLAPASVDRSAAVPGAVADGVYIPLQTSNSLEGVLHVVADAGSDVAANSRLLVAAANLAAGALERQRLAQGAARSEALREADRLKSTLVSSVSHELKTPLAAATARVTGLLEEGSVCDEARRAEELSAVSEDLERLNDSIGDLLDLSRLESDAWRPHREPSEVRDILGTVLARFPADARDRVQFALPEAPPAVLVDFGQVARALYNLVENALAYSPPGSSVTIAAESRGRELVLWVDDEGAGVPDDEKPRVFDKFFRGSFAIAAVPSGTGLGLAISKEIIRNNGGRVWVEDAPSGGARFLVAFPAVAEEV